MPDQSPTRPTWLAVGGMGVAGMAAGGLIVWFTGDRFFNSDVSYSGIVVQHTLVTVGVAVGLWLTRNRLWRAFAVGLTFCWAVLLLLLGLAWALNDPNPSPGGGPHVPGDHARAPERDQPPARSDILAW